VNTYRNSNTLFSRNSKIFEEDLEQLDYVVEKYDGKKNIQYVSCIGEIKPVVKFIRLQQLDLYRIAILSKQQIMEKSFNKILSFLCVDNSIKFYYISLLNNVFNFVKIAEIYLPKEKYNTSMLIPSLNLLGNSLKNSILNHYLVLYKILKNNTNTAHKTGEKSAHLNFAILTATHEG
jgi:hypothetical protein